MKRIANKQEFYKLSRALLLGNILTQWDWGAFSYRARGRDVKGVEDMPEPCHPGPCLPDSGCDGICMERASIAESNRAFELWQEIPDVVGVRHVRQSFTNKGVSGLMPKNKAYEYAKACIDSGESPDNLLFDEGAIHDRLTIQGEVMPCERHLYLRYSYLQIHQRSLWHVDANGLTGLEKHQMPFNKIEYPIVRHALGLEASNILKHYMDAPSWDKLNEILDEYKYPILEFACFDRSIGVLGWNTLFWEIRTDY